MPGVDADVSGFLFLAPHTAGETACLFAPGDTGKWVAVLMDDGLDLYPFEWMCSRVSLSATSFAFLRLVGLSMSRTVEFLQAPNPPFCALGSRGNESTAAGGLDDEGTPDLFDVDSPACDVLPDALMSTLDSARPSMPLETAPSAVIKLPTAQPTASVVGHCLVNGSIASLVAHYGGRRGGGALLRCLRRSMTPVPSSLLRFRAARSVGFN
jgi:hypothetical protein